MGYARIRPSYEMSWKQVELRNLEGDALGWLPDSECNLEGDALGWLPDSEWVKAVAFDAMASGFYVLTDDDDHYFTCHSIYLEYSDTLPNPLYPRPQLSTPTKPKEKKMGKHALPYNPHRDIEESENAFIEQLGEDLDTWQMIARDLARDITRNPESEDDAFSFAFDILNRLAPMPEMHIHPSEVRPTAYERNY